MRDEGGRPSHKVCAETYRAQRQARAAQAYGRPGPARNPQLGEVLP